MTNICLMAMDETIINELELEEIREFEISENIAINEFDEIDDTLKETDY